MTFLAMLTYQCRRRTQGLRMTRTWWSETRWIIYRVRLIMLWESMYRCCLQIYACRKINKRLIVFHVGLKNPELPILRLTLQNVSLRGQKQGFLANRTVLIHRWTRSEHPSKRTYKNGTWCLRSRKVNFWKMTKIFQNGSRLWMSKW